MPVVVLWFVMALAAIPWAMARARNQGYSMGPWCVLALVFGLLAVAAAYLLPKKDRDESLGEAAARSVTVGAISAGKAIRAAANEHAGARGWHWPRRHERGLERRARCQGGNQRPPRGPVGGRASTADCGVEHWQRSRSSCA
jgi:hypothetical protein